jgi:hypothetical protein
MLGTEPSKHRGGQGDAATGGVISGVSFEFQEVGVAGDPALPPADQSVVWKDLSCVAEIGLGGVRSLTGDPPSKVGRVSYRCDQGPAFPGASQVLNQMIPDIGLVRR